VVSFFVSEVVRFVNASCCTSEPHLHPCTVSCRIARPLHPAFQLVCCALDFAYSPGGHAVGLLYKIKNLRPLSNYSFDFLWISMSELKVDPLHTAAASHVEHRLVLDGSTSKDVEHSSVDFTAAEGRSIMSFCIHPRSNCSLM
jgi:hypothetical protein